jgi:feruloyl-CoA synthase
MIERSVDAIKALRPTLYYNVPVGFEAILGVLEAQPDFARDFFANLDFIFNGGAPLPAALRDRLEAVALAQAGRVPMMVAGWGSTETAPVSTLLYFQTPHANNLGAPLPGTEIKMVPSEGRYELRVKGPNVTPGYWKDAAATSAAFDDDGFYRIGDAGKFVDPQNPGAGILFDGRIAENFKLTSGTWVNVNALRLAIVTASESLISDAVVAGEGCRDIGLLIFPNEGACRLFLGDERCTDLGGAPAGDHSLVREKLVALLRAYNDQQQGSSTRIARFLIMSEPPSAADEEITDKGYINQRRILTRRAELVRHLYTDECLI